jgi:hypothetical protein
MSHQHASDNKTPAQPSRTSQPDTPQPITEADSWEAQPSEHVMHEPLRFSPPPSQPGHVVQRRAAAAPQNVLFLQRTVGNAATRRMIQRDRTGTPAPAQNSTVSQGEQRYNINFRPPMGRPIHLQNVSRDEVLRHIGQIAQRILNYIVAGEEGHQHLIALRNEQWIVGAISDFAGRVSLPEIGIWMPARNHINAALNERDNGNIDGALRGLQEAARIADEAHHRVIAYREGTISGAGRAITVLQITEVLGAAAATVATGGLATGVWASAGVAAATAGTYGMVQNAAGQGSSVHAGLQRQFNIRAMLQRGASDAIAGFVGALAGGALTRHLQRAAGGYLGSASEELLLQLGRLNGFNGPLPRDFFLTTGQRIFTEFLGSVGVTPLTTAVTTVVNRLTGATNRLPSPSEFAHQVWQEMVQGGIITILIAYLTHTMPARRSSTSQPGDSQPGENATPPAQQSEAPASQTTGRGTSTTPERPSSASSEPSIIIEDPVMAAQARPPTPEEAALANRPVIREQASEARRPLDPPNPSLWGQVKERLQGRRWQDVMTETDARGAQGLSFGDQMIHYRNHIMNEVQRLFQGEPAGTASTERTSDVDINLMGDNAGQNMQRAHQWLVENVGADYSAMLRLDLLIDNARSTAYRQVLAEIPPHAQQAMLNRLTHQAEILNLARMMQHAEHAATPALREQAQRQIQDLQNRLGLSQAEIAVIQEMAQRPPSVTERNQLFNQIDALMAQLRTVQDPATRTQIAEQITLLQMRANFHMGEAYISPGAIRQTVQGQAINSAEAYQAALSHLEMFDHAVGQAHGDLVQAARGYELFKYIARYARAARAAGITTSETTYFMRLGDYIYRANRGANRRDTSALSVEQHTGFLRDQHADANYHANKGNTDVPFYVTDQQTAPTEAQLTRLIQEFRDYVNRTLPQMRAAGVANVSAGTPGAQTGTAAAAAAAGNSAAQNL